MSAACLVPAPALPTSRGSLVRGESMLLLADLLGGVLHELNNPLSVVLGQAAVLKERLGEGPERTAVDRIVRSADRLAQVARSFVALAREGASKPLLLSLNEIVEETLDFFRHSLAVRRVGLEMSLAPVSPMLFVDPREARLLVASLVGPALEAAGGPGGSGLLRVETERRPRSGAGLVVSCPGRALNRRSEPRLFEPSQAPGPTLFLAEQITRAFGGTMTVGTDQVSIDLPNRRAA